MSQSRRQLELVEGVRGLLLEGQPVPAAGEAESHCSTRHHEERVHRRRPRVAGRCLRWLIREAHQPGHRKLDLATVEEWHALGTDCQGSAPCLLCERVLWSPNRGRHRQREHYSSQAAGFVVERCGVRAQRRQGEGGRRGRFERCPRGRPVRGDSWFRERVRDDFERAARRSGGGRFDGGALCHPIEGHRGGEVAEGRQLEGGLSLGARSEGFGTRRRAD
mmetsp:Transcript_107508/g.272810  ORF Transcript_107508/g.272810 Transcript_107508/m.272810 type:complete len:220 (+) Transcript_107508:862-1521(+)